VPADRLPGNFPLGFRSGRRLFGWSPLFALSEEILPLVIWHFFADALSAVTFFWTKDLAAAGFFAPFLPLVFPVSVLAETSRSASIQWRS